MKKILALVAAVVVILLIIVFERQQVPVIEKPVEPAEIPVQQPTPPLCGNGVIEGTEECDGSSLGAATCASIPDFVSGTLGCKPDCTYDLSGCRKRCVPNWDCTAWSNCTGTQSRTCKDTGYCNSMDGKPLEEQACEIPKPEVTAAFKRGTGQDIVMLLYRTDDQDAHYVMFVDGVKAVDAVCSSLVPTGLRVDWLAVREENRMPAVYCYAKKLYAKDEEYCKRWTPEGVTDCAYDSKLREDTNFFAGERFDPGYGRALQGSEYRALRVGDDLQVLRADTVLFTMPRSENLIWRYYISKKRAGDQYVTKHVYAAWETKLADGSRSFGIGSNLFPSWEFMKYPPSIKSYSWPVTEGSYTIMFMES